MLTSENDGIYKGPEKTNSSTTISNIYSNMKVKNKIRANEKEQQECNDDSYLRFSIPEEHNFKSKIGINNESCASAIYSMPCFNSIETEKKPPTNIQNNNVPSLFLNESANIFLNKNTSVAASGRKLSYGIYQVANQVLIDYDDDEYDGDFQLNPNFEDVLQGTSIKLNRSEPFFKLLIPQI